MPSASAWLIGSSRESRDRRPRSAPRIAVSRGAVPSPETWPRSSRSRAAAAAAERAELDARRARVQDEDRVSARAHLAAFHRCRAPGVRHQLRDRGGADAHAHVVGAAGEHDRHPRAEHDARAVGAGEVLQLLGEHVAGLDVRHHQDVGPARHRRADALGARRVLADRVVEGQRSVEDAALDLAAIGHLAQRRRVERRADVRIDRLDRREDRHLGHARCRARARGRWHCARCRPSRPASARC